LNTYVETSALLKLVVIEAETDRAVEVWDSAGHAVTSRVTYPEARAAIAAAARNRRLVGDQLDRTKAVLEGYFREFDIIELDDSMARIAGDLAEVHALRGFDAVHLASALSLGVTNVVLATWDRDLWRAGSAEGLALAGISP